jgi:hypothetical protein
MATRSSTRSRSTTPPADPPGRRIEYLPLSSLIPDIRNPKGHDDGLIDASVGRFGFIDPVVRDERTGRIISGHGRTDSLKVMEGRGDSPPDGVRLDEAGAWLVPVVVGWSSRSDTEASAALIALNRTTELGGWVDDALLELLDDLSVLDDGLVGVGFGDNEITALRERLDALDQQDFLGDVAEQEVNNPFSGRAHPLTVPEEVNLTFAVSEPARRAVMRMLTTAMAAHPELATRSAALLYLLGVEDSTTEAAESTPPIGAEPPSQIATIPSPEPVAAQPS